ncbi:MOSC domain-containing protein [Brevibacillus sp. SIMBA_040]|uniref:MOSC domain-containing protein n=1 Tax=unclassified Brevibacillus TaxID=2684853 RepID=UPI00397880EC
MKAHAASIEAILIADNPETFVTRRIEETKLEFGGIPGDRHFGVTFGADSRQTMYPRGTEILNRRQITVVSQEDCAIIAENLKIPFVLPEWLGANLLISGFPDLTSLTMGSRILLPSGAGLICMGENLPCVHPGEEIQKNYHEQVHPKLAARFVKAAFKRRGIVCAVECPGMLKQGDQVQVLVNNFANPMQ